MFNGKRDHGSGGWGGGNKKFGDKPQLFRATCAKCGNSCEVPFKPNGSKPVYCRDCFKKEDGGGFNDRGGSRGFSDRPSYDRPSFEDRKMYQTTCASCGNSTEVPFRPTGDRPVYCKACFGANKGGDRPSAPVRTSDGSADQLKAINAKLDAIMKMLAPASAKAADKPAVKAEAAPEAKVEKKAKPSKKAAAKKKK